MGTNYYVRTDLCDHCGRYEEHHICKSLTSFEAKRRWDEASFDVVIDCGSWAEWRDFLRSEPCRILDEYGKTFAVEEFIAKVEAVPLDRRGTQHGFMVRDYPHEVSDGPAPEKSWLDADGFSFTAREFS